MRLRPTLLSIFLFLSVYGFSQINDDFADGDFATAPPWQGDVSEFVVTDGQLNSNGPRGYGELYLSTPSALIDQTTWEFYIEMDGFAPSASNKIRVYLVADQADLEGPVNGYFIEIGESGDDFIHFKRSDAGSERDIVSGATAFDDQVRVRVTRSEAGEWTIYADHLGGSSYVEEAIATDNTYTSTSYFGVFVDHTSSRKDKFYFDDFLVYKPLEIDSVGVTNNTSIVIDFDQWVKKSEVSELGNYSILDSNSSNISVTGAERDESDLSKINLTTDPLYSEDFTLMVNNLRDSIAEDGVISLTKTFSYTQLDLQSLLTISDTEIQLTFNDDLDEVAAETLSNYSINNGIGQPVNTIVDELDPRVVTLTLGNRLFESTTFQLSISNIQNVTHNSTLSTTSDFNFVIPLIIDSAYVTSNHDMLVSFNKILDASLAEDLTSYGVDSGMGNPASAVLLADFKSVLLSFEDAFPSAELTLIVRNIEDQDGNVIDTSGNTKEFDYLNIEVSNLTQAGENSLEITFNQELEAGSAELTSNYTLTELGSPLSASYNVLDSTVTLVYDQLYHTSYYLTITDVENGLGNATSDERLDSLKIAINVRTPHRFIIINEIMADPTPAVGLPAAEYVELYNPSPNSINLDGFFINDEVIPEYILYPEQYVVLTDDGDVSSFTGIENVVGVSTFDALTNTGEALVLKDHLSNTVDSLSYDLEWYRDDGKSEGGYSLELIDPLQPCSGQLNWIASGSMDGGTPGYENAVRTTEDDLTAPNLIEVKVIGGDTLLVEFSEAVDSGSFDQAAFTINGNNPEEIVAINFSSYYLILASELRSEAFYDLQMTSIADCFGNVATEQQFSFYYDVTAPIFVRSVVLSENEIALVFHEPMEESAAEDEDNFILEGFGTKRAILQDSAKNRVHISFEESFSLGGTYKLNFGGIEDTLSNVSGSFTVEFTYQNEIDTVRVISNNILEVSFTEVPTPESSLNPHNYFISEDWDHPLEVVTSETDSTIFRVAFEDNFPENSELYLYLESLRKKYNNDFMVTPAFSFVLDTRAPSLEDLLVKDDSQLILTFDEKLDISVATSAALYLLEGKFQPTEVVAMDFYSVRLSFAEKFEPEKKYTLRYTGLKDQTGNTVTSNRRVEFVYDEKAPEVANAVLMSDTVVKVTFSEPLTLGSATQPTNYGIENLNPYLCEILGPDSSQVNLIFTVIPFQESTELHYWNVEDRYQNASDSSVFELDTYSPRIVSVTPLSESSLRVSFNKPMDESAKDPVNYLLEGFIVKGITELSPFTYQMTIEDSFRDGDSVLLAVENIKSIEGEQVSNEFEAEFETYFQSLEVIDPRTLRLEFSTEFSGITKSQFELDGNEISLVLVDGKAPGDVQVILSDSLPENEIQRVLWQDLTDAYGRPVPDFHTQIVWDTRPPEITEIVSDYFGQIRLFFSERPNKLSATSINKYQILAMGNPGVVEIIRDSIVTLNFGDNLVIGESYSLLVNEVADERGNALVDTIPFIYQPPPVPGKGDILITEIMADPTPAIELAEEEYLELYNVSDASYNLRALNLVDESGEVLLPDYNLESKAYIVLSGDNTMVNGGLMIDDFPTLDNSGEELRLETIFGDLVDRVQYSRDWYGDTEKDDGGYSLELINPFSECPGITNWVASANANGGTPGQENSVYSLNPDDKSPYILQYELINNDMIQITFSEAMDSLSLISATVSVENLNVSGVEVTGSVSDILLIRLENDITEGILYEMTISGATDCSGNVMEVGTFSFGKGKKPSFNELLITEIMADPEPAIGLPNSEYLEIYNASDKLIDLAELSLIDEIDTTQLPGVTIPPKGYLLLTPNASLNDYEVPNKSGLSNWLSLNNSGEQLKIEYQGELIFEVEYSDTWYNQEVDGGRSLEMKDLGNPCGQKLNWGISISASGGTPGLSNSVPESVPDSFGPHLKDVIVISPDSIVLQFDESLYTGADEVARISIVPEVVILTADQIERNTINVKLARELVVNQVYELEIADITDCNGNPLRQNAGSFVLPDRPDSLDVIINEALFNPRTDGVDFVELYNNSDSYFDLNDWKIGRVENGVSDLEAIIDRPFMLGPNEYLALSEDTVTLKNHYPEGVNRQFLQVRQLPPFPNEEGTVVLVMPDDEISDRFHYHEDLHLSLLESADGVSLERISFDGPTQDPNNWQSAAASVGFATPGYVNSQSFHADVSQATLEIEPKVFVPGTSNAAEQSFTTINYQFDKGGQFANVTVYNQLGQPVAELANGESLSTSGFLTWDGTDATGGKVRRGYYVVLFEVYDGSGNQQVLKETVVVGR